MYSIVNNLENKVIATLDSDRELIDKVDDIRVENEDVNFSVLGISDAKEYIEDYCDNLDLLIDSEVEQFLEDHAIEVQEDEPSEYVELIMDNHKCTEWKGVYRDWETDRKSTRLNSSHSAKSRMPSSA